MVFKIIFITTCIILVLRAIFWAVNDLLYQHRIIKVEEKQGNDKKTYFLIQKRRLLFFWKDVKFYSVKIGETRDDFYEEVLYKKRIEFESLLDAKEQIGRKDIFDYRDYRIYKIHDYNRGIYDTSIFVCTTSMSGCKYYDKGYVILNNKGHISNIFESLLDAKDLIDSKILIVTKTVVFP